MCDKKMVALPGPKKDYRPLLGPEVPIPIVIKVACCGVVVKSEYIRYCP